jgi:hypothetical protein
VTFGKHNNVIVLHPAKTKIDQNLKATQRRPYMARPSHFVQLKDFGRTPSPRLRQPFQVIPGWIRSHGDKIRSCGFVQVQRRSRLYLTMA